VAEATGAAVVTTPAGKGTFPEDHPQAGGVFGNFGTTLANDLLGTADVVVVVGSKLGPSDTANEATGILDPSRQRIVQVDIEPLHASWTMPTAEVVVADAGAALDGVLDAFASEPLAAETVHERRSAIGERARTVAAGEPSSADSATSPLHPQRAIAELRAALPDDVIVTCDAGENRLLMSRYFTSRRTGGYLQPAGAGGMGYAIPAAIGAKTAHPDRVVVAVCGDGGFSMSLPALLTAVEEGLPIVVVVLDNGILGWVQHSQRARGELEFKSTLHKFDYAGIAEAAGFAAWRVSDPGELEAAVGAAVAADRPAIVVAQVSTEQTFVDLRTPHLAGAAPVRR
jgi:acetolactate synthase-1/2/3 large subunit